MNRRWSLVACAVCCVPASCESEVTLHLLGAGVEMSLAGGGASGASSASGAGAPAGGASQGGDSAAQGADGGDSGSSVGGSTDIPTGPCAKLGPEACNGGDDDCNGVIDDGCNFTVAWTKEPDKNAFGHPTGGVMFLEPCGVGSVLTGLRVGVGNWLDQVAAICRAIALRDDAGEFSATLGSRIDLPTAPGTPFDSKSKLQDLNCPDGSILTGVDGTTTEDSVEHLLGMRISCAPPIVVTVGPKTIVDSDRTKETTVGPLVCTKCSPMQPYNYANPIPTGRIASGLFGSAGLWVDRVGFSVSLAAILKR